MIPVLEKLMQKGLSKYRIAQCCGVSWGTVWNWVNGHCEPNEPNALLLLGLLEQKKDLPDKKIVLVIKKKKGEGKKKAGALIAALLAQGYSKYALAKKCGVKWNTVQCWAKDKFAPEEKKLLILEALKS